MKIIETVRESDRIVYFKFDNGNEYKLIGNVIVKVVDGKIEQLERHEFHKVVVIIEKAGF